MNRFGLAIACVVASLGMNASAHENHKPTQKRDISSDEHPWGREGDPLKAVRTIKVDMADSMRFTPSQVKVKAGDTIKFAVHNTGKVMHEMVIGTEEELRKHADLMKKYPGMEHDEPYMAHVKPGGKEEFAWTFTKPGTFMFGCLIPGHWEAGMKGTIVVAAN